MKMIALGDVFTRAQLSQLSRLHLKYPDTLDFVPRAVEEVIEPALPQINEKTGQENDAHYWAYAIWYVMQGGRP